jgi:hypothetical protein
MLVQQFSLAAPQLVRPAPLVAQLVPEVVSQTPFVHVPEPGQATADPQDPVVWHVCKLVPEHCVAPGLHATQPPLRHTGVPPEHSTAVPHVPLVVQVCTPLPEHCVSPGVHAPVHVPDTHAWLTHASAFCQVPLAVHVCGCVVSEHCISPGAHTPWHAAAAASGTPPPTHVWFTQALPLTHAPASLHACGCVPVEHCVEAGAHATHAPARHAGVAPVHGLPTFCQPVPDELQSCGWSPLHWSAAGVQTPPPLALVDPDDDAPEDPELPPLPDAPSVVPSAPPASSGRSPSTDVPQPRAA